jgi:hypothetical protein
MIPDDNTTPPVSDAAREAATEIARVIGGSGVNRGYAEKLPAICAVLERYAQRALDAATAKAHAAGYAEAKEAHEAEVREWLTCHGDRSAAIACVQRVLAEHKPTPQPVSDVAREAWMAAYGAFAESREWRIGAPLLDALRHAHDLAAAQVQRAIDAVRAEKDREIVELRADADLHKTRLAAVIWLMGEDVLVGQVRTWADDYKRERDQLRAQLAEAVRLGSEQAEAADRLFKAMGAESLTIEQTIELWLSTKAQLAAAQEAHNQLLYAVERKFDGETRHETALRYIREAEARANSGGPDDAARKEVQP